MSEEPPTPATVSFSQLPPPVPHAAHGRSVTPRRVRSLTPLQRHVREKSGTPVSVASWRSITPFLKRVDKELTPFELGPNILMQLASYQAIFDKALVMDISGVEEHPAKYILSEQSVFDKAAIMDISNVEYVYVEEDVPEEEHEPEEVEEASDAENDETQEGEDGGEDGLEGGGDGDGDGDGDGAQEEQQQWEQQQQEEQQQQQQPEQGQPPRESESPSSFALELEESMPKKKPPPKRKKLTPKQREAEARARAAAEEEARLAAEEEAQRLAEEAEQKRLEEEAAAALAAAEAAAAALIAAEQARLLALEKAAADQAKRDPEKYKRETQRREKEYQTALAESKVPHIRVHLLDTSVEEGGNVKLACSVTGTDLIIKWYRDGHPIYSSDKYHMSAVGETISLEILKTKPSDSGEYMCRLHNEYGDTGNSAIVSIYDVVKSVPQLPSFDHVEDHYRHDDDMLTIQVHCPGFPRPVIYWDHNDAEIRPSTKYVFIEEAHDVYRLEIYQPTEKDSGVYVLRACNESGVVVYWHTVYCKEKNYRFYDHEQVVLSGSTIDRKEWDQQKEEDAVQALKDERKAKLEYKLLKGSGYGPAFRRDYSPTLEPNRLRLVSQLPDRIGLVGFSVRMSVWVLGPKPTLQWFVDDKPLVNTDHVTITTKDGMSIVDIVRLKLPMTGEYSCVATHPDCEEISTSCYLRVYDAKLKESKLSPIFTLAIKDVYHTRSNQLVLSCRVRANPLPLIEWTKDDLPVPLNERIQQTESYEGLCELYISRPTSEDNGVYGCCATNNVGCIEQEHAVFYPQLVDTIKTICLEPQEDEEVPLPPLIDSDGTVVAEVIPEVKAEVKTEVSAAVYEDQVIRPLDELPIDVAQSEPEPEPEPEPAPPPKPRRINPLKVLDVDPDYVRRHVLPSLEEMQNVIRRKLSFATYLKDRVYPSGKSAKLSVVVQGPDANAKWTKNEQPIANGPVYKTNAKDGIFSLEIVNCTAESAGEYAVTVRNAECSIVSSCTLQIYAPQLVADLVPTFTRSLKHTYHLKSHQIFFDTNIRADPKPLIKWSRDGKLIAKDGDEKYSHFFYDDGTLELLVNNPVAEDSGKYKCRAINRAGESSVVHHVEFETKQEHVASNRNRAFHADKQRVEQAKIVARGGIPIPEIVQKEAPELEVVEVAVEDLGLGGGSGTHTPALGVDAVDLTTALEQVVEVAADEPATVEQVVGEVVEEVLDGEQEVVADDDAEAVVEEGVVEEQEEVVADEEIGEGEAVADEENGDIEAVADEEIGEELLEVVEDTGDDQALPELVDDAEPDPEPEAVVEPEPIPEPEPAAPPVRKMTARERREARAEARAAARAAAIEAAKPPSERAPVPEVAAAVADTGSEPVERKVHREPLLPSELWRSRNYCFIPIKGYCRFASNLSDRVLAIGSAHIKLTCYIDGENPTIKWFKDDVPLVNGSKYKISNEYCLLTLKLLEPLTAVDAGIYRCVAKNGFSEATTEANLQLFAKPEPDDIIPIFDHALKDTYNRTLNALTLNCVIRGEPRPKVLWSKDGLPCKKGEKYEITRLINGTCELIVNNVTQRDMGRYICKAENRAGKRDSQHTVNVRLPDPTLFSTTAALALELAKGLPTLLDPPEIEWIDIPEPEPEPEPEVVAEVETAPADIEVVLAEGEDDASQLADEGDGEHDEEEEQAEVEDEEDLADEEAVPTTIEPESVVEEVPVVEEVVIEEPVVVVEELPVEPVAITPVTEPEPTAELEPTTSSEVEKEPTPAPIEDDAELLKYERRHLPRAPPDPKKNLHFSAYLVNLIVASGSNAKFTCYVEGPSPNIRWFKYNPEDPEDPLPIVASSKYKLEATDGLLVMTIVKALLADDGKYFVVCRNPDSEITCEATLTVYRKKVTSTAPFFINSIKDTYNLNDDQILLECRVRGDPMPKITWSVNNRIINSFSDPRIRVRNADDGYCRLIINEPCEGDNGMYACLAENKTGDDKTTHKVDFEGRDAHILGKVHGFVHRNINMPSFENQIGNHMITEGGTIGLLAELLHGVTAVQWFHEGVQLQPSKHRVRIFQEYELYTLIIANATADDAGVYTCRASNKLGRVEACGHVDVVPLPPSAAEKTEEEGGGRRRRADAEEAGKPPQFSDRPKKNQLIETGKPFSFTVSLDGLPDPKLIFLKGLRDLTFSDRLLKEQNGNKYRFTLKNTTPRDSGTYWMVARNELGTDRAFVTISVQARPKEEKVETPPPPPTKTPTKKK